MASTKDLYELGETPPAGHVPRRMYASVIRLERYGEPRSVFEVEHLWMRQKRLQGSHFANREQCSALNDMVVSGQVDPALAHVFAFDQIGQAHQTLRDNTHPAGNLAIRVNTHDGP